MEVLPSGGKHWLGLCDLIVLGGQRPLNYEADRWERQRLTLEQTIHNFLICTW